MRGLVGCLLFDCVGVRLRVGGFDSWRFCVCDIVRMFGDAVLIDCTL